MTERVDRPLTADGVLDRIRTELELPRTTRTPVERRLEILREMQREFRNQPIGGRLVPLKKIFHWFTASAFDRQAKVVEGLLDVIAELDRTNRELETGLGERSQIARGNADRERD